MGERILEKCWRRWRWFWVASCAVFWLGGQPLSAPAGQSADAIPPLAGTVVGEGSHTQALFRAGDHFAWVKVGQLVATGFRLIEVRTDRVTVQEEGTDREIRIPLWDDGSSTSRSQAPSGPKTKPPPRATRPKNRLAELRAMTPRELERLNEEIKAKFERARAASSNRRTGEENRRRSLE